MALNRRRPNAYLVGAPKAGSSALGVFLNQHPQISVCQIKEPNFHCRDLDLPGPKTEAEYLSLFNPNSRTKVLLDGSILSLYSMEAAKSIAAYKSDAKIIMILRNPIESVYSWHSQMVFTGNEPILDFEKALAAEAERKKGKLIPDFGTTHNCPSLLFYSKIMDYSDQISRFLQYFSKQQILILFHDDLKADAKQEYVKVLKFLDLDEFSPTFKVTNPNKIRRNLWLHSTLKRFFAAPTKALLPSMLRLRLINILDRVNSVEAKRKVLDESCVNRLKEVYEPKIMNLEKLLQVDLAHWR
jgi:hypothetical protein